MYTVNQEVGVVRYGNWGSTSRQGLYRVTKSNKMRVHLQRISDGYERVFSAKTGVEQGATMYRTAQIVTVDQYAAIEAAHLRASTLANSWNDMQEAAKRKNIADIKSALAVLESLSQ